MTTIRTKLAAYAPAFVEVLEELSSRIEDLEHRTSNYENIEERVGALECLLDEDTWATTPELRELVLAAREHVESEREDTYAHPTSRLDAALKHFEAIK